MAESPMRTREASKACYPTRRYARESDEGKMKTGKLCNSIQISKLARYYLTPYEKKKKNVKKSQATFLPMPLDPHSRHNIIFHSIL